MSSLGIHGAQQDIDVDAQITEMPNEGQQTMANSISVAIASDQTAVPVSDNSSTLSIDDGAGSITVDGPLTDTELRASPVVIAGALVTF